MPRNGSGVMSKPPNTTAQPNTVIQSAMFNSVIDDLITDANFPRPVVAGGTGGTSQATAQAALGVDKKFVVTSTTGLTADATHNNGLILVTTTATIALTAAGTLGSGWHSFVSADGGIATIDPNGSQKINGALTLVLQDGQSAFVYCTNISGDEFSAVVFNAPKRPYAEKSANYTVVAADNDGDVTFTAAATAAFTAAATLGASFRVKIRAASGDVVLDPNGAEQIVVNGVSAATFVLKSGQTAAVTCNGTLFYADVTSDPLQGAQIQGFATGLALSTNAGDATNDVDFAAGAAASDASPYFLMPFSAMTKRLDATFTAGNNGGMLDTGVVGNNLYYLFGIGRSDTGATDYLGSLSSTAPTMPANYDRKRLLGLLVRTAGVNRSPYLNAKSVGNTGLILLYKGSIPGTAAVDWTVPSSPHRYVLVFSAFSTNGTGVPMLQLKTGGAAETSGYSGGAANSGTPTGLANSSGFYFNSGNSAALSYDIVIELVLLTGNTWVFRSFGSNAGPGTVGGGGTKTLAGPIDGLRLTTPGGVNIPDNGEYALYVEY